MSRDRSVPRLRSVNRLFCGSDQVEVMRYRPTKHSHSFDLKIDKYEVVSALDSLSHAVSPDSQGMSNVVSHGRKWSPKERVRGQRKQSRLRRGEMSGEHRVTGVVRCVCCPSLGAPILSFLGMDHASNLKLLNSTVRHSLPGLTALERRSAPRGYTGRNLEVYLFNSRLFHWQCLFQRCHATLASLLRRAD